MKSKRSFIVTIFILVILIFTIGFSQELKLKQADPKTTADQKTTLETRVIELEFKVQILADQVKSLEYKIDNPKAKIVPVK